MKIRRTQYNIDYVHILTFREEYKKAVLPFFGFDNLRYGIDNENTLNESIRLIFTEEALAVLARKEGITMIFEGDIEQLKSPNSIISVFWKIYEKISNLQGFKKASRHSLIVHAVDLKEDEYVKNLLKENKYLAVNPFGKLSEFGCVYEFEKDDNEFKFEFGNYNNNDIKKHDLRPFNTEASEELVDRVGIMCRAEIREKCHSPNHTRFKALGNTITDTITSFNTD